MTTSTPTTIEALRSYCDANEADVTARLVLADALQDDGQDVAAANVRLQIEAERKAAAEAWKNSCLKRTGITGNVYTIKELTTRITRRRPRGSGGKAALARRLADACDRLANARWARITRGTVVADAVRVDAFLAAVRAAITEAEGRCSQRTLRVDQVVAAVREADREGRGYRDGGSVTASSYGHAWTTTTVRAARLATGEIEVVIERSAKRTLRCPVAVARALTA